MDVSQEFPQAAAFHANAASEADPRLLPTPDYGTLGPGSDVVSAQPPIVHPNRARLAMLVALAVGMLLALLVGSVGKSHSVKARTDHARVSSPVGITDSGSIDRLQPQKQAEELLEMAVANSDDAVDQISSRVGGWRGKLAWNSQMASLTAAALSSSDIRVRESGVEVELAAYGLSENSASLEYLLKTVRSSDHHQKIWALWALGLIANRGVEPDRVAQVLSRHLQDSDTDSRRWAVDGLALTGGDSTIPLLLRAMHDDSSPIVREEAACAIAQSGMYTSEQRMSAVPQLLNYTDDPSLDAQMHGWAFQALSNITGQHLPNDSTAWRSWYENRD